MLVGALSQSIIPKRIKELQQDLITVCHIIFQTPGTVKF